MITVLLFLLMSVLPTTAVAQPQYAGPESAIQTQRVEPYQYKISSPNAKDGLMWTGSQFASEVPNIGENNSGNKPHPGNPKKLPGHEEEWWVTPIGDALWPLALLACAYLIARVVRRRVRS